MGQVRRPTYTTTDPTTGEKVKRVSRIWWLRWYRNGVRHEESSGTIRKSEAERLLKLREGDVAKGLPVTAKVGKLRVEEALADVVRDYKINARKTTDQVERRIRLHLEPFFGGRRMASVTGSDVTKYTEQRQEAGATNATIRRELAILKRAYRIAEQDGTVLHRPHIRMPGNDNDNVRTGFFDRQTFEDVRGHLPKHLRGLVTILYTVGWRVGVTLSREWRHVDRQSGTIRLDPGEDKNEKAVEFPYGQIPELVEVIDAAWSEHQRLAREGTVCPFVFHRNGSPIRDFRTAWKTACREAGVPGMRVHDFRRSAARNLIRAGVPQTVAKKITNHLTDSMFERYNITDPGDVEEAAGMLARYAEGKEKGKTAVSGKVRRFPEPR